MIVTQGSFNDRKTFWKILQNGTLIINGHGDAEFDKDNNVFQHCKSLFSHVIILNGVKSIGDYLFADMDNITGSILIPDSVHTIGQRAFSNCINLDGFLELGASVYGIGTSAFYGCEKLSGKITIPPSVRTIGIGAFCGCKNITAIEYNNDYIDTIKQSTFYDCAKLNLVTLPLSLRFIDGQAFENCTSLKYINLHKNLDAIKNDAFKNCPGLKGKTFIFNKRTSIETDAFDASTIHIIKSEKDTSGHKKIGFEEISEEDSAIESENILE